MNIEELGVLFLRHRPDVIRIVGQVYTHMNEDTLDQLYVELWVSLTRLNEVRRDTLRQYLITALKNRVKNYMRDCMNSADIMDRFPILSLSDPDVVVEADRRCFDSKSNDPTLNLDDEESNLRYDAIMSGLPATLRLVAELYFIDGCTQEEIACHLKTYPVKVRRMIIRATKLLQDRYTYYRKYRKIGLL